MAKKKTQSKKKTSKKAVTGSKTSKHSTAPSAINMTGKQLVIVESPSKAKNINQYLGEDYVVQASVGHVRDLPSKAPKGSKQPVPGVDLENDFKPTYEILSGKKSRISELKRLARKATNVWFATDLDREGEAIAWHIAQELGIASQDAKRVVFNAVTKTEIQKAFSSPHPINEFIVNAQQARRILDRIVGYQVSPLLWKKVARGLSAGRVQSVAVRIIVERERDIRAFIADEYWNISARFTTDLSNIDSKRDAWSAFIANGVQTENGSGNSNGNSQSKANKGPSLKEQNAWLAKNNSFKADLYQIDGKKCDLKNAEDSAKVAERVGFNVINTVVTEDVKARGPACYKVELQGVCRDDLTYVIGSIETKRTTSRPPAPFITSTLQQAASTRLGYGTQRTMRIAQQLYEGIDLPGRGTVGLITYMRTDSTHLSAEAVKSARDYINSRFGNSYLPGKPNSFTSSNRKAQEAHEAIRPASIEIHPDEIASSLKPDQAKLYRLIWNRFVACQMANAQWDATTVQLSPVADKGIIFRAAGRQLVFDGFYKVAGIPTASEDQTLPTLDENQNVAPISIDPLQKFTSPPPRFTEASLVKTLEEEGIGRPSTYAEIIQKIQDRKYVEQRERRFYSTDLGEVVTDKLIEAFPNILSVGFTRELEDELDRIEARELEWVTVLKHFYIPFSERLDEAHATLAHAKAETQPAPYKCEKCQSDTIYRFGKNGRFLSCSKYPDCDYASPIDADGAPVTAQLVDVACPKCGKAMQKRSGRFGSFLGCPDYPVCDGILKLDKKDRPIAPQPPPITTELLCSKCEAPLNLRNGARGPWMSCSKFPKCKGRGAWTKLDDDTKNKLSKLLAAHEKEHPIPIIRNMQGEALTDAKGKPLESVGSLSDNGMDSIESDINNADAA